MPARLAAQPAACRHCGTPLDALARTRGLTHCNLAACRQAADAARTATLRAALARKAQDEVARRKLLPQGTGADLPVVWLQHWDAAPVPLGDGERAAHRAFLESAWSEGLRHDPARHAALTAQGDPPQGRHLCAECQGACCRLGGSTHAFIDATLLQRWLDEHPGASPADAVQAYVDMLPAQRLDGGCLYQTTTGCAMPRRQRADVCNGFACASLQSVQRGAAERPGQAFVSLVLDRDQVMRAVVIDDRTRQAFELPPHAPPP